MDPNETQNTQPQIAETPHAAPGPSQTETSNHVEAATPPGAPNSSEGPTATETPGQDQQDVLKPVMDSSSPSSPTAIPTSKSPVILTVIVLILALAIGGIFIVMSRQTIPSADNGEGSERPSNSDSAIVTEPLPTSAVAATAYPKTEDGNDISEEESELNAIDLGDIDSDFKDIEADIDQL